ncbi:hypothetical protein SADUNF_Sadunf05G0108800 [Salix dunnii]|uniref:Uncharacterized protein n=1 Tax=Salix dunnii TaxID=1413687 RepID=A0A835K841_9ROSI|nr:hypothetical protein SADUNF_Sadunf05G0108800 [Salix dunnii]
MAEEKASTSIPLSHSDDNGGEDPPKSPPHSTSSSNSSTRECMAASAMFVNLLIDEIAATYTHVTVLHAVLFFKAGSPRSSLLDVLFPVAVTFFITWWLIQFVDGFFSPIYARLGIDIFDQNTTAFKEVAIIRHPRVGEYAFGFITSSVILQRDNEDEELCSVFVPTNHLYIGDIFLVNSKDIIRPNLSIREGIEIIVSGGMSMPQMISPVERVVHQNESIPLNRMM